MQSDMALIRMLLIKQALKLEVAGMTRKGKSAYAVAKSKYNLRGNKKRVYTQLCELYEAAKSGKYAPPM